MELVCGHILKVELMASPRELNVRREGTKRQELRWHPEFCLEQLEGRTCYQYKWKSSPEKGETPAHAFLSSSPLSATIHA